MSAVLKSVSDALVEAVAALDGSVVRVEARQRLPGTGVVWSADGMVVTASHVVERDHDIHIGLADSRSVAARLVGRDPGTDLALLKAEATGLQPPIWAGAEALEVGRLVLALGRTGAKALATLGIIGAVDEGWHTPAGGYVDYYVQSDTVMYPGFSGGPLVEAGERQVLGVNSSALASGLSVTVPAATVRRTVESLLQHRRVRRGYLGVTAQAVPLPDALRERLGQESGLLLTRVEPNSPADRSRLVQGDTLVTLASQPLRSLNDLMQLLDHGLAGDQAEPRVPVRVIRAGQVLTSDVQLAERASR